MSIVVPKLADITKIKYFYRFKYLINPDKITKIFHKLDIPSTYGDCSKLKVLEMYPGPALQSTIFYNEFKPKQHFLMESRPSFVKFNSNRYTDPESGFSLVHKNPYNWESYTDLIEKEKVLIPSIQSRDHINTEFLVMANLTEKGHEGLVMQWVNCMGHQNWLMKYGLVKMLLWVPATTALKLLSRPGAKAHSRCSIMMETFSNTKLVAISDGAELKLFDPDLIEKWDPIICDDKKDMHPVNNNSVALIEINPRDRDIDYDNWDYITRQLMILKKTPLIDSLESLGHGARNYFVDAINDPAFLKKSPIDLTPCEFEYIMELFVNWPFKPDIYMEQFDINQDETRT
ncbi:RNA polymerase specificity factor KNAG_0J02170 [Huiozyma naganishii CBS 8797]|uniref:rRNA adenine N(6)-methyltransferase n=1 Tax=Huiozyma naganishii (strain ATCC MYA-139 / BCRC 22969 / CBS 8797 / KCTC 17520 / NBRC 10181 / NCYC 3082 / Yp74L-3) TaxID=1071383 RepID=J7RR28_HUIN7|nr:hypothetical protein KNAG_0J02170 [Kazachstania naganishii CBS 8797]CCK72298.1 hypothetical protein KNAG_0J02170 [Kazachstania naganishii CBS 8797]